MEKLRETYILIKLAKMTVTEINSFTEEERSVLSNWFLEAATKEAELAK